MKNRLVPFSWKQAFKTAVILIPPAPKLLFFSLITLVLFIFPHGLCSQGLSLLLVFPSSWFVSFWNTLQLKYTAKTEDNSSSSWCEMERSIHGFTSNSLFQFLRFCGTYRVCDAYVECRSFPNLLVCHCFLFSICTVEQFCWRELPLYRSSWVLSCNFPDYFCSLSRSFWISNLTSSVLEVSPCLHIICKKMISTLNFNYRHRNKKYWTEQESGKNK